jgi:hypothetical protein
MASMSGSRLTQVLALLACLARQRLVQFAVIAGALFAIAPPRDAPEVIHVTRERLAELRRAELARPKANVPLAEQAAAVDRRQIEDEILYREGLRLGLDKNDGIVRQRVVQKVLFLAEEMGGASRPVDEAALQTFFEANKARWAIGGRTRFAQVYRHDRAALAAWIEAGGSGDPPRAEPGPVASEMDLDADALAHTLGTEFAESIGKLPAGAWSGPVKSAFGFHLVRVIERHAARPARLEEVRGAVVEAYSLHRRQEATAAFVEAALARYRITVDDAPLRDFTPSRRIAFRSVSSGED